jgi:hypothetical protein
MRSISIIILTALLLFSAGCNENSKKSNTTDDQQIAQKKSFDPIEDVKGLCRGTVFLAWDVITLGYDKKEQGGRKEEVFTRQQANNVGFLKFFECISNGFCSGGYYGGGYYSGGYDTYRDRGYGNGYCWGM